MCVEREAPGRGMHCRDIYLQALGSDGAGEYIVTTLGVGIPLTLSPLQPGSLGGLFMGEKG